jgi:hypothetical protein
VLVFLFLIGIVMHKHHSSSTSAQFVDACWLRATGYFYQVTTRDESAAVIIAWRRAVKVLGSLHHRRHG